MAHSIEQISSAPIDRSREPGVPAETDRNFRRLVEVLPDAILVHCNDKIVFVNPSFVRLLCAEEPEQLLGKDISYIFKSEYLPAITNQYHRCYSTRTASPPMEALLIGRDGSSIEIEAVAIPTFWNGSPAIQVVARDIKKRKQAEQSVHEWQKRMELAQKAGLRIGLWDWDVIANTVVWSDETYRQFGYTQDTFSGRVEDALTRLHVEDRSKVERAIRSVLDGRAKECTAQYRVVRPDGTTCWIEAHGVIVRNGSSHMLGIGVDVTDLKMVSQSLQESEDRYLLLLNSTAEAIYGIDLQGNCTFCNPACARLLGYRSPGDVLGRNMLAVFHHTRLHETPYPESGSQIYDAGREGRPRHVADQVLRRADGTCFSAEYWAYPMYKSGELVGAVVTFLDISSRKRAEQTLQQSEEKYRNLFENATYGLMQSSPDGALLDVNPALVTMLGYSSKQELLTRNLQRDIYQDPVMRKSILHRFGTSGRVDGVEVNWKRKDGKSLSVRLSGGVVRNANGAVSHFDVIVEDTTERRSLEEQYRQAQKMEAVGLLAGGISHDFNNLLGVILGNVELLLETTISGKQSRYAEAIKKAGSGAAQLTRQLLAFSRKQVLYPAVLNLNTSVRDIGKILQRLIGEDVHVVTELAGELGSVRADRGQIEQILMNLATNARDAMPGGGRFTIRTQNTELGPDDVARYPYVKPGRYVRLSACDTGVGMSEEVRVRIFEPFFTTKPQGRGTGLGLATVYGIVKQSGGYIWISSAPGKGAMFDIYLPRLDEETAPAVPDPEVRSKCPRGEETIIVLEDEDSLREVTCEFLYNSGYNVLEASSGTHAIEVVERHQGPIALIISDVILPDISGPSIVTKMQVLHPEMRAMYVSGYAEVPITQQLVAEGATLLQKPVSRTDLLRKVDEMLHRRSSLESQ